MNYNSKITNAQVSAMHFTDKDLAADYQSISSVTHNGRHAATWDRRFQILQDILGNDPQIELLAIYRSSLWTFSAILDKSDLDLYIMVTDQNLKFRRHEIEIKHFSTHYLYSLLHYNNDLGPRTEQLEMFPSVNDAQNEYQHKDCEKMLGEWANKINKVLVTSFVYDHSVAISGTLDFFNNNYQKISSFDLSNQLLHQIDEKSIAEISMRSSTTIQPEKPMITLKKRTRTQENQEKLSNTKNLYLKGTN